MSEEWGPWIEHDGNGCPCRGQIVMVEFDTGEVAGPAVAGCKFSAYPGIPDGSWRWSNADIFRIYRILRYRIRKPRGLTILESILADLPEKVDT